MDEQKDIGAGASAGGAVADGTDGNTAAAAGALYAALQADPNYGNFCSSAGATPTCQAIHNFKVAYNASLADPPSAYSGSPLAITGLYDQPTSDALKQVLGSTMPVIPGTTPNNNNVTPPANPSNQITASTGWPMWLRVVLWIVAIGGAIGLGLWLWKTFGSSRPMAAEPKRKRGKRTSRKR
ncbi:MAG: hypothetical protein ACYDDA_05190 [Acidiferrobacteraceae bacterium]